MSSVTNARYSDQPVVIARSLSLKAIDPRSADCCPPLPLPDCSAYVAGINHIITTKLPVGQLKNFLHPSCNNN